MNFKISFVLEGKMEKEKVLTGKAKFDINRNDMFWTRCLFTHEDGESLNGIILNGLDIMIPIGGIIYQKKQVL